MLIEMLHVLAKITKNLLIITMVMLLQGISTLFITEIRKLLAKGLNFREKQPLNATKAY